MAIHYPHNPEEKEETKKPFIRISDFLIGFIAGVFATLIFISQIL